MFDTSRDILNWVLSLCIFSFTVFLCFALYYLIATARGVYKIINEVSDAIQKVAEAASLAKKKIEEGAEIITTVKDKVNDIFKTVKDKLSNTSSYLMIIGEVLKRIFDFMQNQKEKKMNSKK